MSYPDINLEHLQKITTPELLNLTVPENHNWIFSISGGADSVLSIYLWLLMFKKKSFPVKSVIFYFLDHGDQTPIEKKQRTDILTFHINLFKDILPELPVQIFFPERNVLKFCAKKKKNFEYVSSRLRHKHWSFLKRTRGDSVIVTGHNLTDWIETVHLRLNRGTRQENIYPFDIFERQGEHVFFRPAAFMARESIRRALAELKMPWWEDPHNNDGSNRRSIMRKFPMVHNEPGLAQSARNFIRSKNSARARIENEILGLLPMVSCISRYREYRIELDHYLSLDQSRKDILIDHILQQLHCWPISEIWREGIHSFPFNHGNLHVETENWDKKDFLVLRRGRNHLNAPGINAPAPLILRSAKSVTKKYYIPMKYGKKSLTKIFSEKRISGRQRSNLILAISRENPFEVHAIYLDAFGIPNVYSADYENYLSR